jgi:hypothetical protein
VRRLGLGAVPIGLMLVAAAVALAWWNEGRAVRTERALAEGERRVVSVAPDALASVAPGTLVHVTAPATTAAGVTDPVLGVRIDALRVRRSAETLQWRRSTDAEDPDAPATYRVEWSATRIDSSAWPTERQNPATLPVPSDVLVADDVRVAGVLVAPDLVARSDGLEALPATTAMARAAAAQLGLGGTRAVEGALFLPFVGGNPDAPAVGDVRVHFERVPAGVVSLVGAYTGDRLEPAPTRAGPPVALFRVGSSSATELFAGAHQENRTLTGGLRFAAAALTFGGFRLALHPLAALARLVPLLGGLLGLGVTSVALVLGASTAATTVAVAWLAFRPWVALPLLAAAVAGVVWLVRRAGARRAPVPATPALLLVLCLAGLGGVRAQGGDEVASVEALRAAAAAGGTHRLAATTFELVGALRVDVDLTLIGAGAEATVLRLDPAGAGSGVRVAPGALLRLEGLGLTYVGTDGGDVLRVDDGRVDLVDVVVADGRIAPSDDPWRPYGVGTGFVLRGSAHGTVTGGAFERNALAAVEVGQDAVLEVDGVRFEGNAVGVFADARTTVSIAACAFSGHSGNALHVRGSATATVSATSFTGDGRVETAELEGFDAVRVGDDARVAFEDVLWRDHPRFALSLFGQAQVTSRGGRFEANGGVYEDLGMYYSAILVEDGASLALDGDVLDGNTGGAIEAVGSSTVVAQGVTVARTGTFANVYVGGTASVRFQGGDVFENEGAMFATEDGSLTIRGGRVRDGAGIGIQAVGRSRLSVEATEVTDHLEYGIAVMEDATAVVRDAFVAGNRSGIVAFDRSRLRAERNVVASNERSGIGFLDASSGEAAGNRVGAHGLNGIVVGDDGDARVVDNVLEGNVERGVFFAERATGHVSGNTIRGSGVGLAVVATAAPEVGANVFEDNGVDRGTGD